MVSGVVDLEVLESRQDGGYYMNEIPIWEKLNITIEEAAK